MGKMRLTKEAVYKVEHNLIYNNTVSVFDIEVDKDYMLYLARAEGIMEMAKEVVKVIEKLDECS